MGRRLRRAWLWAIFGAAAIPGVACGLDARGTLLEPAETARADAAVDVAAEAVSEVPVADPFCDPTDPDLILCVPFDGQVADDSVHRQAIEVSGPVDFVPGVRGSAVVVGAATTLHVPHGDPWDYSTLTVELWFRPDGVPDAGRAGLFDKNGSFGVFLHPGGIVRCIVGATVEAQAARVGAWTHVACVNDGEKAAIYVDGARVAEIDSDPVAVTEALAAIGGDSPSGDPLSGALDGVRVFARARTVEEVAAAARR